MIDLDEVRYILRDVHDADLGLNVLDLGLIYDIIETSEGHLEIRMTLTATDDPMYDKICRFEEDAVLQVVKSVWRVKGVQSVRVDVVWEPPWTPCNLSAEAKLRLGKVPNSKTVRPIDVVPMVSDVNL